MNFGSQPNTGFSFGAAAPTAGAAAQPQLSFGTPQQQGGSNTGSGLGSLGGLGGGLSGLGGGFGSSPSTLTFGATAAAPQSAAPAPAQLSFGSTAPAAAASSTASVAPQLGTAASTASAASTLLSLGGGATSTSQAGPKTLTFGLGTATSSAPASTLSLGGTAPASAAQPAVAATTTTGAAAAATNQQQPQASLSTTTTTTASSNAPPAQLNFCQLEEYINKWTLAVEEQEKMFLNQATQVNSWDKVLTSNNNKIVALSESVEKVKIDQQALEQELEFIAAQHAELDECITPLEQELSKTQHMDADKAHTYVLAENLDTQLRQMSDDLKEVIEHLNESNKVQDTTDPIVKIGLILNAHMSSLQWIESSTAQVLTKIDDISNIYDTLRRDNERSMRLTYD